MNRLLLYSQDGMGLGHLRRSFNIARAFLARCDGAAALIIGDSPALSLCPPLRGLDYLKLPTLVKTSSAEWRTETLPMDVAETLELRKRLMLETFLQFRPDAVLVDHMPVGVHGELKPLLDRASEQDRETVVILGLRDVLDAPEVVRGVWAETGVYEYLDRYDAVIVYGRRDIYDVGSTYGLDDRARRVTYCNYVTSPSVEDLAPEADKTSPLVLVMGGGGADAFPIADTFLRAVPLLREQASFNGLILTGPSMAHSARDALAATAEPLPVRVGGGLRDAVPLIRSASVVLTMAGYNSLCEILKARAKALVVPRAGPSAEQRIRSQLFSDRGLISTLAPEYLSPETVAERLGDLLGNSAPSPDPESIPPLDGAERVSGLIVGALRGDTDAAFAELAASG